LLSGVHKKCGSGNKSSKCRYDGICPTAILLTLLPARELCSNLGDELRLQVAKSASRSAPSPAAAWEQWRRRQILGQERLLGSEGGPGDLLGHILPALARCCLEKVDLNVGLQSCHVGYTELGRSRSPLCAPPRRPTIIIMASLCSQSTSINSMVLFVASSNYLGSSRLRFGSCRFWRPPIHPVSDRSRASYSNYI